MGVNKSKTCYKTSIRKLHAFSGLFSSGTFEHGYLKANDVTILAYMCSYVN